MTSSAPPRLLTEVRWNWDWSPWATALILVAAAAWVIAVYANEQRFASRRKRALLALLRLVTVALVLVMLAQPTIERTRVASPRLVLLIDHSMSMDTPDIPAADLANAQGATSKISRLEAARHLLTTGEPSLLNTLEDCFHLETYAFDATPPRRLRLSALPPNPKSKIQNPKSPAPASPAATRLGEAIDHALRQLPGARPAAAVILTDGINTAGLPLADAAERARTIGVPLHIVALGSDRPRPDVSLDDILVEEVVFPGDRLQIEAAIRAVGYAGKPARVTLKRADADELLAETQVTFPADGEIQTVRLALRPTEPGPLRVALEVEPQPGEDDAANNRTDITIDVRDSPIRVLLVESTPSFEYRALKSLLERDPAIRLRVRLQDADADYASVDEAALRDFPATEAELLEYDVILLGDVDPQLLPRQTWELLEKFVSMHGGGLVLIAGQRFMPRAFAEIDSMRPLLPFDASIASAVRSGVDEAAKIEPTPLGLQDSSLQLGETAEESAAIWAELPPVLWSLNFTDPKPGVQILARRLRLSADPAPPDAPIITRHYVGAGEVLAHATDETWRWRWRNDDRYFARYWGQAVRRAARGRAQRGVGSLSTNQEQYDPNEPITLRLRLSALSSNPKSKIQNPESPVQLIELAGDSTPTRQIPLPRKTTHSHLYETTLRDLPPDHYTARVVATADSAAPLTAEFDVVAPPSELAQLVVNTAGLAAAADATGGQLYTAKTAARLADELPAAQPTAIEQLPDEPLWNSPWLLAALCITLTTEWLLRRRSGML